MGRPFILSGRVKNWVVEKFSYDFARDDSVLIVGSGRSGTSWLAALCNYQNSYRYIFEPLNPDHSGMEVTSWSPNANECAPELRSVLEGRNISNWSLGLNRKMIASKRLIKEIRLNLALDWVRLNYPATKIVKIVRNPLAVAASKKSLTKIEDAQNWVWKPSLTNLLADPSVREKLTTGQYDRLSACTGQGQVIEAVADWCLNNLIVRDECFTIWYESLLNDSERELKVLFEFLDIPFSSEVLELVGRPSTTTRLPKGDPLSEQTADRWRLVLTSDEVAACTELLHFFDVAKLYNSNWQPARSSNA